MENSNAPFFYGATPEIFKRAGVLRKNMTPAEKLLWKRLERKQIHGLRFRRQHPVARFIADFYCHAALLIIEIDGGIHHDTEVAQHDREREIELRSLGLNVMRFTNREIMHDIDTVIQKISATVQRGSQQVQM